DRLVVIAAGKVNRPTNAVRRCVARVLPQHGIQLHFGAIVVAVGHVDPGAVVVAGDGVGIETNELVIVGQGLDVLALVVIGVAAKFVGAGVFRIDAQRLRAVADHRVVVALLPVAKGAIG